MTQLVPALERLPPQALEAEQAVLGAMMIERTAVESVREILLPEDFYREAHRRLYEAICALDDLDEPADPLTVAAELERRAQLDAVGGRAYLNVLINTLPAASRAPAYARRVQDASILRRLIEVGGEVVGMAYDQQEPVDQIVDEAERLVFSVGQRRSHQYFTHIKPLLFQAYEEAQRAHQTHERVTGIATGFTDLDDMTSGLQPSDLIIIAGRPSMGKTALALNIAVNAADRHQVPAALFSLEMSRLQLIYRLICSEARVDGIRLRSGYLRTATDDNEDDDWTRLGRAIGRLGGLPVYIDDSSDISALEMRAKCRRLRAEHGLGLVIVDYLQLVRGHGRVENRTQEISLIARSLKSLARELNVPIIALSQLSRNVERRDDKRPMLSDLRESGSIEAEADLVLMLFRSSYYDRREASAEEPRAPDASQGEVAEVIVAKHRNGPTGVVRLEFLRRYAAFGNLAEGYEEA
ncbi:MAG: replicative DNA helicase [Armatimonadetes bacterium]|nr:replicative DNA helicase [Armatimonadota bacterium]